MTKKILVVGGAGYIGSHCVLDLKEKGYTPVVLDNFSTGDRKIAQKLNVDVIEGDISSYDVCIQVLEQIKPEAVMHFAAYAYVGESVTNPAKYYSNNVSATLTLLTAMKDVGVNKFIFSSTCATYGIPDVVPITEKTPQAPINPYGHSKLMVEQIIKDFSHAYGLKYVMFRYFNAAGAHPDGEIGEIHDPETHLIPLTIFSAQGKNTLQIFGSDYPTSDGTCIRDYIHISDIALAHRLGVERLLAGKESDIFNIGNGLGYSIKEVIESVEEVSGCKVSYSYKERRAGDPPSLVADATKIKEVLGWQPAFPKLKQIIETAWRWHASREPV